MSHIVQIQTEVRDQIAIESACRRLHIQNPFFGLHMIFTKQVEGWGVRLPGWIYPVVCQTSTGSVQFDNYGGRCPLCQHPVRPPELSVVEWFHGGNRPCPKAIRTA